MGGGSPNNTSHRVARVIARMNVGGPAKQIVGLHGPQGLDPNTFHQLLVTGRVGPGEVDELLLRDHVCEVLRLGNLGARATPPQDVFAAVALRRSLADFRPAIVHTHTAKAGMLGRLAAWSLRPRPITVHSFHGHLLTGYFSPPVRSALVAWERAAALATDHLIAVGRRVRDDLLAAGIGRPDQFTVVSPGIELPPLPPRSAALHQLGVADRPGLVISFAGRLVQVKRPDRLLQAFASFRRDHAATLLIAGTGPLESQIRVQALQLGIGGDVVFLGTVKQIEWLWAASDVAVLSSDNEGMPVALIEAALAGLPAVTTDAGSSAEVVEAGQTGIVTERSAESLAAALSLLAANPDRRRSMGERARLRARELYSLQRLVGDVSGLYLNILSERARPQLRRRRSVTTRHPPR
jgi:glycosyltransferase involved in cell wall biosynthesis